MGERETRREKRIRELRELRANPGPRQPVLFVDEVDIDLNPQMGRDWMLPGTQRRILTPGKNEKRYLAGAYDPIRQRMVYVEGGKKAGGPDENRIERVWRDLHANVTRNHRCRSIGELLEAVRRYLNARFHTYEGFCPA